MRTGYIYTVSINTLAKFFPDVTTLTSMKLQSSEQLAHGSRTERHRNAQKEREPRITFKTQGKTAVGI